MSEQPLDKKALKKQLAKLTEALLDAQFDLRKASKGPLLVLISGNDFAGKAEAIYAFYDALDNRFLSTRAFALPNSIERKMPRLWRYWRSLPPAGQLGFYLGSWYHQPLMQLSRGKISKAAFEREMQNIVRFEQALVDEGVTLVKLWLHLTPDSVKTRPPIDPELKQTVAMREWGDFSAADYEQVRESARLMSELTSTAQAPWTRVESHDARHRDLQIGQIVLLAMQQMLKPIGKAKASDWTSSNTAHLGKLDYQLQLDKPVYKQQLEHYQNLLRELIRHPAFSRRSLLLVFEGTDAAGKGGAIRRITQCLDPRYLRVHGTSAPTEEERSHPYLWRFWRRVPAPGSVVVFDRSYYGRVLVERVEGFVDDTGWQRAYQQINDFETQLVQAGTVVIKFWLSISEGEQLKRFEARDASPVKRYKLTDEDWRNRKQWPAYEQAVNDMVDLTSAPQAPWHLISAQDKRYARVETLKIVCETLRKALR
ncbi:MAG TPA: polyphosphate:AMP phosphotransferase [Pseudomonas xinjiangensis]|uniref:Polyphosphate:AMP phosphotransferase n=2 Tax=root TaxID=1 RepID=A0A7V1BNS2_9GAMM|nr:polyphosphate:AMP phosphotransferase [Halopseudomonas xinjiangensis]HEC48741.1 polyphosphate:AMP phosphotransferase [Halopseudomonas xinjiangensis]